MPTITEQAEYIEFAAVGALHAVPTSTPGWKGVDYSLFYGLGSRVGDNRPIAGVQGRLHVPRGIDEMRVPLRIKINGRRDREGIAHADPWVGVMTNFLYLRKHLLDYLPTRSATLHRRDGTTTNFTALIDDEFASVPDARSGGDHHHLDLVVVVPAGVVVTV